MTRVTYEATDALPDGVPAAVIASRGKVTVLLARDLTVEQVCEALTPLISEHAQDLWTPDVRIA